MANMSYCRNENTYKDLVECLPHIDCIASGPRDEEYRIRLLKLMIDFVESGDAEEALLNRLMYEGD